MPIGDGNGDSDSAGDDRDDDETGIIAAPFLGLVRVCILKPAMEDEDEAEEGRNAIPLGIIDMDMVSLQLRFLFLLVLRTKPNHLVRLFFGAVGIVGRYQW